MLRVTAVLCIVPPSPSGRNPGSAGAPARSFWRLAKKSPRMKKVSREARNTAGEGARAPQQGEEDAQRQARGHSAPVKLFIRRPTSIQLIYISGTGLRKGAWEAPRRLLTDAKQRPGFQSPVARRALRQTAAP